MKRLRVLREAMATPGKDVARRVVVGIAEQYEVGSILDLWGGGESARAFVDARPDAAVLSIENDRTLMPGLMADAQRHGYAAFCGDLADVPGLFDLVWLDVCGQASKEFRLALRAAVNRTARDGHLAVTVMPAREPEALLSQERLFMLPTWVQRMSGMKVRLLYPYRRVGGLPMWLLVLHRNARDWWAYDFDYVEAGIAEDGFWSYGLRLPGDVWAALEHRGEVAA